MTRFFQHRTGKGCCVYVAAEIPVVTDVWSGNVLVLGADSSSVASSESRCVEELLAGLPRRRT